MLIAPVDDRPCVAIDVMPVQTTTAGAIYAITHVDVAPPNTGCRDRAAQVSGGAEPQGGRQSRVRRAATDGRKNHFEVVEIWADQKAEDTHQGNSATKDYRAKVQPLLGAHYDRRWYRQL